MDFTPELSAFQGAMVSADTEHQFSRLTSKGGNEEKIKHIINSLLRCLKAEDILKESGYDVTKMRKFALYIVLNAELPVLEEMVELEGVDMIIWTIPTIPKHLMCEMLWNLDMEQFIYEIISYSYPELALQVLGAFVDNFKYFTPTECTQKLYKLSGACYLLICRLSCFEFGADVLTNKLTTSFEHLQKLLQYFVTPPNSYKLNALSKDELYKYKGRCLHAALTLICECFTQFCQVVDPNCVDNIYKLTYKEDCFKEDPPAHNVCDSPNKSISECLNNSNMFLLDVAKELVMDVSVDVFCAWSEFIENGKSVQQKIGELCDKVRTKLLSVTSVCEHPIVSMIQQIARKPTEIKDAINTTDNQTIIDNINNNAEDKTSWIRGLIHKNALCEHLDLLQVIDTNLHVYNDEECYILYNMFSMHMKNKTEHLQFIKTLLLKVFQCCNISDKHRILKETFTNGCFCDMTQDSELLYAITEMFNKLIVSPDAVLTDILTIFLQNPKLVYTKIFYTASENAQQSQIMLEIMKLLADYSNYYYNTETEACIISITKNVLENSTNTDSKHDNVIKFICGLKTVNIIQATKLLLMIIMPNMHKSLLAKDVNAINVQVKLLRDAFSVVELLDYRAPMLAMLAQVLDVVRWNNILTFVPASPATLDLTLQLQNALLQSYNGVIPDKDSKWLKSKLRIIKSLNMYYYRILWNPPGRTFFEVISQLTINTDTRPNVVSATLNQLAFATTQQEWCEMWDSLSLFGDDFLLVQFHASVASIIVIEDKHRTENSRACLMYCYRNLIYIIRYKYFRESLTDDKVLAAVHNLAGLLKNVPVEDVEEIGTILMPLLAYLAEKKSTVTIDMSKCLHDHFRPTKFADLIGKMFPV